MKIIHLGLISYPKIESIMQNIVDSVQSNKEDSDFILLLAEHEDVYTAGSGSQVKSEGVEVCKSKRGGQDTYHGRGQLMAYCIANLKKIHAKPDIKMFVNQLEDSVIDALSNFGIKAQASELGHGVWVPRKGSSNAISKIASIGIRVSRWVTSYGIGLNVNTDLCKFNKIVACGIEDCHFANVVDYNKNANMENVSKALCKSIKKVFTLK